MYCSSSSHQPQNLELRDAEKQAYTVYEMEKCQLLENKKFQLEKSFLLYIDCQSSVHVNDWLTVTNCYTDPFI